MAEFDPKIGFRPTGNVLKFWTLLPQVSSNSKNHPPLFGKIKGIAIYYGLVAVLLLIEGYLAFNLNEEGLDFKMFVILSIADFAIVILPALIHLNPNYNGAIIDANIFINEKKRSIDNKKPETIGTKEAYLMDLKKELNKWKANKRTNMLINLAVALSIIGLAVWKFVSYYSVLGDDIFTEAIGRFILTGLIIGILVHIICTKIVFYHIFYKISFNSQLKEFDESGSQEYKIFQHETNKKYQLTFNVPYTPVVSNVQRIYEELDGVELKKIEAGEEKATVLKLNNGDIETDYRIDKIKNRDNAMLVYTGLLTDGELSSLAIGQADADAKTAIIVSGKEIQLNQITAQ